MSHFNLKSLAFYGTAIGSVVVLFTAVTAYGNNHLKAPPAVDGRYQLDAENLPGCLKGSPLVLTIQQSGEYLGGYLLPGDIVEKKLPQKKVTLAGKLHNQQLSLSGSVPGITRCQKGTAVTIQGQLQGKTLIGKIALGSSPQPADFTAEEESPEAQTGNQH